MLILTERFAAFVCSLAAMAFVTRSVANSPRASPCIVNINARVVFLSLAITVMATSLIGYKVSSRSNGLLPPGRFNHVLTIIFESAAVYSITLLAFAVDHVLPSDRHVGSAVSNAGYYLSALVIYIAVSHSHLYTIKDINDVSRGSVQRSLSQELFFLLWTMQTYNI